MNKVYTKFLLQWVTNVVVAVAVEMVYVAERSEQFELVHSVVVTYACLGCMKLYFITSLVYSGCVLRYGL